ncbi:MAG TPA: SpoIIE family protein phosphatase [Patescibacteria group bacterium]|nr:SpoIIE family protein phosphatase [Patescibacteria group bacterium]
MWSGNELWRLTPARLVLLTGILLFLANWIVVMLHIEILYQDQVSASQRENHNLAKVFAFHTERMLATADNVLLLAREEYESQGEVTESLQLFLRSLANSHLVTQIAIADREGRIIHTAMGHSLLVDYLEFFRVHRDDPIPGVYVGQTRVGRLSGKEVVHLSRRLDAPDGSFNGIVFMALQPDAFIQIHEGLALAESQTLLLLGMDGAVRVRREGGITSYGGGMDIGSGQLSLNGGGLERDYREYQGPAGDRWFIASQAVNGFPLVAVTCRNQEDALAWFRRQRLSVLQSATAAAVVIALATFGLYRFYRRYGALSQRYEAIVNQSREAMVLANRTDGRILDVNDSYLALSGYSRHEALKLHLRDVFPEGMLLKSADRDGHMLCRLGRRDGGFREVETLRSIIAYGKRERLLFSARDVSAERERQQRAEQELNMAASVQRSLLPRPFQEVLVAVDTIYEARNVVSGDYYDVMWSEDHQRFSGFLLDISGHGVASSLQGIIAGSFFRDAFQASLRGEARLHWVNRQVLRYFTEESYCAAVGFEVDFAQRTMTYLFAGIYRFLAFSGHLPMVVNGAGSLIGVTENPEFTAVTVPITAGDIYYFLSDGLYDQLPDIDGLDTGDYPVMLALLRQLSVREQRRDDCSAICIRILDRPRYPLELEWHNPSEQRRIRFRLVALIRELGGEEAAKISIVLGEAINNAARESMDVRIRLNRIGQILVIRVKDGGCGFAGNDRVAKLRRQGESVFEEQLLAEGGRGIFIMAAWMDTVLYNRTGNEVLLTKRL